MQPRAARDERGRFPDMVPPTCRVLQGLELKHIIPYPVTDNLDDCTNVKQNLPLTYF